MDKAQTVIDLGWLQVFAS